MSLLQARWKLILALAGVLGALVGGWLLLRDSGLVAVKDVTINGVSGPQAPGIRDALTEAARDMTTLRVDEEALRAAVARYAVVADVQAEASPPRRLQITVRMRQPVAALDSGARRVAVAADGVVLPQVSTAGLPTIRVRAQPSGSTVRDAATVRLVEVMARAPEALRVRTDAVFRGPSGLTVVLRDGPRLRFGTGERLRAKWVAATRVLSDPQSQGASYIDLRLPERPAAGGLPATDVPTATAPTTAQAPAVSQGQPPTPGVPVPTQP